MGIAELYVQKDLSEVEAFPFAGGNVVVFCSAEPGKSTGNEDSVTLIPINSDSGVLAVADGVGGMPSGAQASRIAVETLAERLGSLAEGEPIRGAVLDGIEMANEEVLRLGGAATTVAVVAIYGYVVRPFHVGDSLILVTGQRGKVKFRNIPHSPTGYAVESGFLDHADAIHHEDSALVSNVVGDPEMRIDIGPSIRLAPRDTLVIASDGLSDNLILGEIVDTVRVGRLDAAGRRLARLAHSRMVEPMPGKPSHPDDLSFVLYRPNPEPRSSAGPR